MANAFAVHLHPTTIDPGRTARDRSGTPVIVREPCDRSVLGQPFFSGTQQQLPEPTSIDLVGLRDERRPSWSRRRGAGRMPGRAMKRGEETCRDLVELTWRKRSYPRRSCSQPALRSKDAKPVANMLMTRRSAPRYERTCSRSNL